ncbi:carbohydrate kinase family protein [Poriferisphaera corsica]|nr:carbohydrate kinase family protein [Poriferisphaera corsica]
MAEQVEKEIDVIVAGSCVADLVCRPVPHDIPIGEKVLHEIEPIQMIPGGITANAGITLARLGCKTSVFTYVGADHFGRMMRVIFEERGVDVSAMYTHPEAPTSTTAVLISDDGERSFLHAKGAPKLMDLRAYYKNMEQLESAKYFLWAYYGLNPQIEGCLPKLLEELRMRGTKTAIDAAGDGGGMKPLEEMLPHLDVYVPSYHEAKNQTGKKDVEKILKVYRDCGAPGILGVKLGKEGAVLSGADGELIEIDAVDAPGEVVDTTGAGDCFYAGLLTGLVDGYTLEGAGRLAAAAGACAVTALGGWCGTRARAYTNQLAGFVDV